MLKVFLSYKVQTGATARLLAAWFKVNGIEVWFAEEQIPSQEQFAESYIENAIIRGIEESTHYLLLTNSLYAHSPWCQKEFDKIKELGRLTSQSSAEICLPHDSIVDEKLWTNNSTLPRFLADSLELIDLDKVDEFLREQCRWPLPRQMKKLLHPPITATRPYSFPILGLTMNVDGWVPEQQEISRGQEDFLMSQSYVREIQGRLRLHVLSSRYPRNAWPGASSDNSESEESEDITLRKGALEMLDRYQKNFPSDMSTATEIHAVHLIFLGNRSHFGFTYSINHPALGKLVARKYILVAWDPATAFHYEIVLTFYVYGPLGRLVSLSPLMDSTVQSLRFSESGWKTFEITNREHWQANLSSQQSAGQPHPLSETFGDQLSPLNYPAGYFEDVPPDTLPGPFKKLLILIKIGLAKLLRL